PRVEAKVSCRKGPTGAQPVRGATKHAGWKRADRLPSGRRQCGGRGTETRLQRLEALDGARSGAPALRSPARGPVRDDGLRPWAHLWRVADRQSESRRDDSGWWFSWVVLARTRWNRSLPVAADRCCGRGFPGRVDLPRYG